MVIGLFAFDSAAWAVIQRRHIYLQTAVCVIEQSCLNEVVARAASPFSQMLEGVCVCVCGCVCV